MRRNALGPVVHLDPRDTPFARLAADLVRGRWVVNPGHYWWDTHPDGEPIHAPGPEPGNDAFSTEHIPLDRCWREGCGAQIERDDDVGLCQACVIELRDM